MGMLANALARVRRPRAEGDPAPEPAPAPGAGQSLLQQAVHEAAGFRRRLRGWLPASPGPRREHQRLALLRARSRDACRNNAIARAAIERLTADIVGLGVSPKPLVGDEALRTQLIDTWETWSDACDAHGQTDFYGLQTQAVRAMLESGEVLALLEPGELAAGVPLKVRLLEGDHLPFKNEVLANGHQVVDGIEFDRTGQRCAYWLHPRHPGDAGSGIDNDPVRVPAARVLHLFESYRPGQLRGIPVLAPVLVRLKHLDDFDDAQLERQRIANLFVGFIRRKAPEPGVQQVGPDGRPLDTGEPLPPLAFEPGTIQELGDDEDMIFATPPGTSTGYTEFTSAQLRLVASCLGLPYPFLSGDYSQVNDRTMRVAINEYKRRAMALVHNVLAPQLCAPLRRAWADAAVLAGVLPTGRTDLAAARWTPNAWDYIHPVQEIQADVLAIDNKIISRSEAVLKRGYDAELIDREIAADLARERALGLPPSPAGARAARVDDGDAPTPPQDQEGAGGAPSP